MFEAIQEKIKKGLKKFLVPQVELVL